jgi:hypothetical protein
VTAGKCRTVHKPPSTRPHVYINPKRAERLRLAAALGAASKAPDLQVALHNKGYRARNSEGYPPLPGRLPGTLIRIWHVARKSMGAAHDWELLQL